MPDWLQAGLWGAVAGGALLLGAAVGYWIRLPKRVIAGIMAFGSGVLISALSFELVEEAYSQAGLLPAAGGFMAGALIYSVANGLLNRLGAKHRKRSSPPPSDDEGGGSGAGIALGALLDGIPESMAIGLTMLSGGGVSVAAVTAIFISNLPEGLSSAAGMKASGRSASFVFGLWLTITVLSALAAVVGYSAFAALPVGVQAATTALAAGAILAMLAETMMPEAFEGTHDWCGIITCTGFLCAFALSKSAA